MADPRPCDFCGAPVIWTPEQEILDITLKLKGRGFCAGLGVMCDACGDKQIALEQAAFARGDYEEADDG